MARIASRETLLLCALAAAAGCADDPRDLSDGSADAGPADAALPDAQPPDEPYLVELARVCTAGGGVFAAGECTCPTDEQDGGAPLRLSFDARNGGSCTRPTKAIAPCASGGLEKLLGEQGLAGFRSCVEVAFYGFRRAQVLFRLPATWTSADDARPLARWLDQRLQGAATFYAKLSPPPDTNDRLELLLAATSLQPSDVRLSLALPVIDPGVVAATTTRYLHVPSLDALDGALGNPAARPRPPRAATPPADAGPVGVALERALAETRFDADGAKQIETILQRCLGMCDVRQDYSLPTSAAAEPIHAWRVRRYQSGVVYRETLAVGSADGRRVDGWVVLDLGGEPSLIFRVDYGASRLKPTIVAFDRNWQPLGTFAHDLLPDATQAATAIQAAPALRDDDAGVILWDTGITFDDSALASALLVGPHVAAAGTTGGSALGWHAAASDDASTFLDGVRTTVQGILPFEAYPSLHGTSVARLLLGQDRAPIRVLPTSLPYYVAAPEVLGVVARTDKLAAHVRVINLSAFWPLDPEACRAHFPNGLDARFVWVAGAGNSGRMSTPEMPLARCPQSLRGDNLLVVAGAEGLEPWPLTDGGSGYADLAADCKDDSGFCGGTSNAAPRVARTAALIVKQYGDLIANPMVRMAILLAVTLPETPGPYGSGGYHNHDDALRAAGELVRRGLGGRAALTASQAQQVLYALYPDHAYADRKLAVLQQTGTFTH